LNIPDPNSITIEKAPHTVLFPGDEIDQIFSHGYDRHASALFGPMWEYSERKKYSYIFMTREFLNLLHALKERGLVNGVQAEFGCSPWPATNIWFEDPDNDSLPEVAKYGLRDRYWAVKYQGAFKAIIEGQNNKQLQNRPITRLLIDNHFMVHRLATELQDHPITAEMELRGFNNEKDMLYDDHDSIHDPSLIGFRIAADREIMTRLRKLNELSFESARRKTVEAQGFDPGPGKPYINGAILSALFNYIPWKAFLKKLDEYLLPGGLVVVYNAQEGERAHLDWKNIAGDQETITAFIREDLGYILRIHELRKDAGHITPLYLVAQKKQMG
jgi:hypothetical protein